MVTSFKGDQKLIFEGYRYNIHHIVPAKGVKTWRCVCAKKLTSARSWCKGRAETSDDVTQGISKGEHNHTAEHEIAELDSSSQLILAAIASPNAALNVLIDEATKRDASAGRLRQRDRDHAQRVPAAERLELQLPPPSSSIQDTCKQTGKKRPYSEISNGGESPSS